MLSGERSHNAPAGVPFLAMDSLRTLLPLVMAHTEAPDKSLGFCFATTFKLAGWIAVVFLDRSAITTQGTMHDQLITARITALCSIVSDVARGITRNRKWKTWGSSKVTTYSRDTRLRNTLVCFPFWPICTNRLNCRSPIRPSWSLVFTR